MGERMKRMNLADIREQLQAKGWADSDHIVALRMCGGMIAHDHAPPGAPLGYAAGRCLSEPIWFDEDDEERALRAAMEDLSRVACNRAGEVELATAVYRYADRIEKQARGDDPSVYVEKILGAA